MPWFLIDSRFSIKLIRSFFLYLASSCCSLLQGNLMHSEQYFPVRCSQELIVHFFLHFFSLEKQPEQRFSFLRKPKQIAQFMPQGVLNDIFMKGFLSLKLSCVIEIYNVYLYSGLVTLGRGRDGEWSRARRGANLPAVYLFSSVLDTIYSPRASRVVPTISQCSLPCCSQMPHASMVSPSSACPL